MKNKILTIIILTMLSLPVCVQAEDEIMREPITSEEEVIIEQTDLSEVITPPANPIPCKQPTSKKQMAKKFLLAMGGVGASSLLIFLSLSAYNKLKDGFQSQPKLYTEESPLKTPTDMNGAVRSFLDKTDWKA